MATVHKRKNTHSQNSTDECDFEVKMQAIQDALKENYQQQKKLMDELKKLLQLHKHEIKNISKQNKGNAGKYSGFNKPERVPESIRDLLGLDDIMMSRTEVTRSLYKYFTDNNMYNSSTKKEIIPNRAVRKVFGMKRDDIITFYNLQTWLKKVYNEDMDNEYDLVVDD